MNPRDGLVLNARFDGNCTVKPLFQEVHELLFANTDIDYIRRAEMTSTRGGARRMDATFGSKKDLGATVSHDHQGATAGQGGLFARGRNSLMHWTVVAPFIRNPEDGQWLVPHVPGERHTFDIAYLPVTRRSGRWDARARTTTSVDEWRRCWRQSGVAWARTRGGVVTVYPQLAAMAGLRQRFSRTRPPVVAWTFNLGALHKGWRRWIARETLKHIDRFIVHSRAEAASYADWLNLPESRFVFVPLQRGKVDIVAEEDHEHPFLLTMGSARRDYETFLDAVGRLGFRTIVVAGKSRLTGMKLPSCVEVRSGLSEEECHRLTQEARLVVVPVCNYETASGQITIIRAMQMGRAVVATRCIGSEDYIEDGRTGVLVEPGATDALAEAIGTVWEDDSLRRQLGTKAQEHAAASFSDEAAGAALGRVLDEVADSCSQV